MDFFQTITDFFNQLTSYLDFIPTFFSDTVIYINYYYLKATLAAKLGLLKMSFEVAKIFLLEIGFNKLIDTITNALPDDIKYFMNIFGVVDGLTFYFNCAATGFVMRFLR